MQPPASPGQPFRTIKHLVALLALAGACAFTIQNSRQEARSRRAAMKAIEESKRTITEVQQKLLEIQNRK